MNRTGNKVIVLDLQHHQHISDTGFRHLSGLTRQAKISEILESLDGAESLEIRFAARQIPEAWLASESEKMCQATG